MSAGVLLVDPKYPFNVGGAQRACAIFGADSLAWTGDRVPYDAAGKYRLPREERLRDYKHVQITPNITGPEWFIEGRARWGRVPVAVEVRENAETLTDFVHPENALYVFGPEDGSLGRKTLSLCHRFVVIPGMTRSPLNLAAAVNVVLYDRLAKEARSG